MTLRNEVGAGIPSDGNDTCVIDAPPERPPVEGVACRDESPPGTVNVMVDVDKNGPLDVTNGDDALLAKVITSVETLGTGVAPSNDGLPGKVTTSVERLGAAGPYGVMTGGDALPGTDGPDPDAGEADDDKAPESEVGSGGEEMPVSVLGIGITVTVV